MYIYLHESQQNRKTDTNINKGIMEINIYFHFNMWLYLRAMGAVLKVIITSYNSS